MRTSEANGLGKQKPYYSQHSLFPRFSFSDLATNLHHQIGRTEQQIEKQAHIDKVCNFACVKIQKCIAQKEGISMGEITETVNMRCLLPYQIQITFPFTAVFIRIFKLFSLFIRISVLLLSLPKLLKIVCETNSKDAHTYGIPPSGQHLRYWYIGLA